MAALNTGDQSSPAEGDFSYSQAKKKWQFWDGTQFVEVPTDVPAPPGNTISGSFQAPITDDPFDLPDADSVMVYYGAAGTTNLPAGDQNKEAIIYNTGDFVITVAPPAGEAIVVDGVLKATDETFTLSSGAGDFVCLVHDGTHWVTLGYKGDLA